MGSAEHRLVVAGCLVWAVVGLAIAATGLGSVNADARALVYGATVVGVAAAVAAAWLASRGHLRWCGVALVVSIVIPTWFAAWVNLVPLAAGVALIVGAGGRPERS